MRINDCEIKIIQGDIAGQKTDAIVNAANNKLVMGGGVAHIIHTATMDMPACRQAGSFLTDEVKIRNSCASALRLADKLKLKSVAFPALGCGTGGFGLLAAAKIMAQEIFRYLKETPDHSLKEIILCLYDKEAYDIFNKGVVSYLEYIIHKLQNGPFATVDAIIDIDDAILLIERTNPPFGWALPGGFVDYGESLEEAVTRETKEETNLDAVELKQFHTYSDPARDPRFHTIGTVFIAKTRGRPKAGDDAGAFKMVKFSEIKDLNIAFDHRKIIEDYIKYKKG